MQEESFEPSIGHVVTHFYVHYDNDGNVHLVSNVKDENLNNFEIGVELIPNFIKGLKDGTKYKIDYFFNINAGLISDIDEQEDLIKTDYILYEIPKNDLKIYDIKIEHDASSNSWTASVMSQAAERLSIVPTVPFYVCRKNNPYFLIASHVANSTDLIKGSVKFEFISDLELDFSNLSVYTIKKFRDYCAKEKE
jgi:hypothetical protein